MWKCKECGGTDFIENICGGNQHSKFDKNGNCIEIFDQDIEYQDVECANCGNTGEVIQNIADWEEEDERD
ncbi:hypothetical protein FNSP4_09440 [Fusobacterium nucleatum]|nr:hypothetical protein FNCP4_03490 [Fusobacterium nucleatum]BEP03210.1 hypothetical protein FNSP4_09440 [Fusobacterium nucleatum]